MSVLMVLLTLVMLLSAVGFVVGGLVLAEKVLWGPAAREGVAAISRTRRGGAMLLVALGGILVVTAIVTAVLIADREAHFIGLTAAVSRLESRVPTLESKLGQDLSGPRRPPTQSP